MKMWFLPPASALAALVVATSLHSHIAAKEAYVDIWQAVGDAEVIVVGTVKESRDDGTVIVAVDTWLKGTPTRSGEVSLKGQTGHCVIGGPVSRFMKQGERFLAFVFAGGKPGRLGHIQKINPDGTLPGGRPAMMYAGRDAPRTEAELARLVKHIQSREFAAEQAALLSSRDDSVAREAARRLGAARAADAFDPILSVVRDAESDRSLRQTAIVALGRLRDRRALAPLVEIIAKEQIAWGSHAAAALAELGDRRAVPALVEALRESTGQEGRNYSYNPLSSECVRALGQIGYYTDEVKAALMKAAELPGEQPAHDAVWLAWQQKLRWMTPALVAAMDSETRSVSGNAGLALAAMAGMSTMPATPDMRRLTTEEVAGLASEAVAERHIATRRLSPSLRDVNGIGWLVTYRRRAGNYYVYVGVRERRANVLLPVE